MTEPPIIDLQGISKNYDGEAGPLTVLNDISMRIGRGEFLAVTGSSGSGKSTLLNIIGCLDRQSGGRYVLNGHDISLLSDTDLSRIRNEEIGFVFQSFNLVPSLSALDNVLLPSIYAKKPVPDAEERARKLLDRVGLGERASHIPSRLSGGQQQRVAIARAFMNQPSVIVADEPTGNLDSVAADEIMNLLADLHRQGATIVLVTHDAAVSRRAGRAVRLADGSIVAQNEVSG